MDACCDARAELTSESAARHKLADNAIAAIDLTYVVSSESASDLIEECRPRRETGGRHGGYRLLRSGSSQQTVRTGDQYFGRDSDARASDIVGSVTPLVHSSSCRSASSLAMP